MTFDMPETQYCGVCGHENVADEERCASCGTLLTSEFNADSSTEGRPIQWRWVEIFFGGMSALLAMVTFVPLVNLVFMHLRFSHSVIVLPGGMITVLPLLMLFVLGGAIMGVVANRAIYREIAIGSLGAVLMLSSPIPMPWSAIRPRAQTFIEGGGGSLRASSFSACSTAAASG